MKPLMHYDMTTNRHIHHKMLPVGQTQNEMLVFQNNNNGFTASGLVNFLLQYEDKASHADLSNIDSVFLSINDTREDTGTTQDQTVVMSLTDSSEYSITETVIEANELYVEVLVEHNLPQKIQRTIHIESARSGSILIRFQPEV
jgi:hypothetical protein